MTDMLDAVTNPEQKDRDEWAKKIQQYEQDFKTFDKRAAKIVDRYRDERDDANGEDSMQRRLRYNILWANTQVLGPAVYSKAPKIEVVRRYLDKDPTGRLASAILERAVTYEMGVTGFHDEVMLSRDDYLLVGRGTLWQRYEPLIERAAAEDPDEDPLQEDQAASSTSSFNTAQSGVEKMGVNGGPVLEDKVIGENAPTDYVHWRDFLHGTAQNWKQVPWVGRKVLMDRASVDKRWPDVDQSGKKISSYLSFTHKQEKDDPDRNKQQQGTNQGRLALIYEFWDKTKFQVLWYSPDLKDRLIEKLPDPLGLVDFFPTPKPLFATMTTDRLVPVPDFKLYQDQASELDILTQRIGLLVKALAVRGVYDGSFGKLSDLLNERPENFMLPVDNWAAFAEKGGLQGITSFVPIDQIIKVIQGLQGARTAVIQDIYAITGISDIIRGDSNPNETAAAQNLKGQYANLRLNNRRDAMANFIRESLRIKAEVMCDHFGEDTMRKISGFDQMTEVLSAQQKGQDVNQLWQQAYGLLKNDPMRLVHLDIQTDSIIEQDMQQEQQQRTMFLQSVGQFLQQAMAAAMQAPQMAPLLGQMLLWGIRGFKVGRELEGSFESAIEAMMEQAQNPAPKPPSPEQIKAETEQARLQNETKKTDLETQRLQIESQQAQGDSHQSMMEMRQALYEFEENIKLQREELMLKYGIAPMLQAALAAHDKDATNGTGNVPVGSSAPGASPQA